MLLIVDSELLNIAVCVHLYLFDKNTLTIGCHKLHRNYRNYNALSVAVLLILHDVYSCMIVKKRELLNFYL